MPQVILHIGNVSFPVTQVVIENQINQSPTAKVELPISQFLDAGPVILSDEARITIDGQPQFTGIVNAVQGHRSRLSLRLAGASIRLKEVRIGAQWGGFPPKEQMYLLLRSAGWPADKIAGLPVDDELRWFDSIFLLQGVRLDTNVDWHGCRLYRLATATDVHEQNLLNSPLGRLFAGRIVARVKVVANEWVQAREKTLQRVIEWLSWMDFVGAIPFAFSPTGTSFLGWDRRDAHARYKLGLWQSTFDLRHIRQWVSRPDFQQIRPHHLGKRRLRRVSAMDPLHATVERFQYLLDAVRWLYLGRQAASTADRILNDWYALEFSVGSETLDEAFSETDKTAIRSALRTIPTLNQRQEAILSGRVDNLNAPTFGARLKHALERSHLKLNASQFELIQAVRKYRNTILHGGRVTSIDSSLVSDFEALVRLIVLALLETERGTDRATLSTPPDASLAALLANPGE